MLDDVAPALAALLDGLTGRQAAIARLVLVDGLRQSDAALRLGVSRPTLYALLDAHAMEAGHRVAEDHT